MALSPFLNSSPKDLAYALGHTSRELRLATGTRVEVFILLNGKPILTTGLIREQSLINHYSSKRIFLKKGDSLKGKIAITKFSKLFPYTVVEPWFVPVPKPDPRRNPEAGSTDVSIDGKAIQSSRSWRTAKSRLVGVGKLPHSARPRYPRSTGPNPGRPSPEFLQRPFLETQQFGTPSSFTTTQTIQPFTVYFREWSGSRTPGWGRMKRKRYVDNNHTARIVDVLENRYSWNQEQAATGTFDTRIKLFTSVFAPPSPPVTVLDLAEFNALKRTIANAGAGIEANMAQNIAQVSQLSSLVFGTAKKITSSIRQLKRGNISGAVSALGATRVSPKWRGPKGNPTPTKDLASNWLELQYGWKPLLQDIEGLLKVMGTMDGPSDFVQKVRGSASAGRQYVDPTYPSEPLIEGGASAGNSTFTITTHAKFVIRFRMENPLLALFAQTGFTSPISLAWEILPFSFVADWFLPIGSYFEALEAWRGMTFLGGSKTTFTRIKTDSTISVSGLAVGNPTVNITLNADYRNEQVRLVRTALATWPSPVLPSFNSSGLSGGLRGANAIALLGQAFKR